MTVEEIVNKLIGPIEPVGESHIDDDRFENLKAMCELADRILFRINKIAQEKNRGEHSISKAGLYADSFISAVKST